jgi:hypothetical protein
MDRGPHLASADRQIAQQLQAARFRLMIELARGTTPAREVSTTFERVAQRFANARVRSFLPILVERAVRAEFGRERGVAAELGS